MYVFFVIIHCYQIKSDKITVGINMRCYFDNKSLPRKAVCDKISLKLLCFFINRKRNFRTCLKWIMIVFQTPKYLWT
jgi:hypothetical protein